MTQKNETQKMKEGTFWEHLESLRWVIVRIIAVLLAIAILIFCFKDYVFNEIILAPCDNEFITYRLMCKLSALLSLPMLCPEIESISLININLTSQLMVHLSSSFQLAIIAALPYIASEIWFYISPALYTKEKHITIKGIIFFVLLFFIGVLLSYYIIFPLSLNFLGSYQVSGAVPNQISLTSYMNTFTTLTMMIGLVFEMPIVGYFLGKTGIIKSGLLKEYRKVAIVIIMVISAMITPSTDIFTMTIVSLPLILLYEITIGVVRRAEA